MRHTQHTRDRKRPLWLCFIALAGCSGQVEGAPGRGLATAAEPVPDRGAVPTIGGDNQLNSRGDCSAPPGGHAPLRRLTQQEYENTVRDLFGVDVPGLFPATDTHLSLSGFAADPTANSVSELGAEKIERAAEAAALAIVEELDRHVSCGNAQGARGCAWAFIERHGPRVLRRELSDTDRARLLRVFDAASQDGLEVGIAAVLSTLLQTPDFLYLTAGVDAIEEEGESVALSGRELATHLSYLLWDTLPDAPLWQAARSGALSTPQGLRTQVERMLDDPRASQPLADFARQWAAFEWVEPEARDSEVLTPELSEALRREFELFTANTLAHGDLSELLLSSHSYANRTLADYYGLPGSFPRDTFRRTALDPTERSGILTQPALLMALAHRADTSYVQRGKFVLEKLLCQELPAPPAEALTLLPETAQNATNRERSRAIRGTPGCGRCHERLDPIGLAFEAYDWIGRYRQYDAIGNRIDVGGSVVGVPGLEAPFEGVVELAQHLAQSPRVKACVARSLFRFALSRVEQEADRCALAQVEADFADSDGNLRELMVGVVASAAFRARQQPPEAR